MTKTKLYLAHPRDSREYFRQWELDIEANSNIELINPFYDLVRSDIQELDSGNDDYKNVDFRQIVIRDLTKGINESQGIVAIVDGSTSYGTIQEMVYATIMRKKVYSAITNGQEFHPWLRYHSDKIFTKLNDLEDFLLNDRGINKP